MLVRANKIKPHNAQPCATMGQTHRTAACGLSMQASTNPFRAARTSFAVHVFLFMSLCTSIAFWCWLHAPTEGVRHISMLFLRFAICRTKRRSYMVVIELSFTSDQRTWPWFASHGGRLSLFNLELFAQQKFSFCATLLQLFSLKYFVISFAATRDKKYCF